MSANSKIQWTDHTFNSWEGCSKVAPECKNCYAEVLVDKRFGRAKWGAGQPRRRTSESTWRQPLRWNKTAICTQCRQPELIGSDDCRTCGRNFSTENRRRPRVFCLSLGDWLDEEVPAEWLADLLSLIRRMSNLDWQLLTKRPQNWKVRMAEVMKHLVETGGSDDGSQELFLWCEAWLYNADPPSNVWIGVSAGADQRAALDIPAKVHFLSCEPMLKPLDHNFLPTQEFDWIIFGGESGKNARPCDVGWIRDGVKFCRRNDIAPFVKQLGAKLQSDLGDNSWPSGTQGVDVHDSKSLEWIATEIRLKDSHGGDMSEWPEDLRVREFPKMEVAA